MFGQPKGLFKVWDFGLAARPLGAAAIVVLATNRRLADQAFAVVVVQRNAWVVDE